MRMRKVLRRGARQRESVKLVRKEEGERERCCQEKED